VIHNNNSIRLNKLHYIFLFVVSCATALAQENDSLMGQQNAKLLSRKNSQISCAVGLPLVLGGYYCYTFDDKKYVEFGASLIGLEWITSLSGGYILAENRRAKWIIPSLRGGLMLGLFGKEFFVGPLIEPALETHFGLSVFAKIGYTYTTHYDPVFPHELPIVELGIGWNF
jgi:hypothetical protein